MRKKDLLALPLMKVTEEMRKDQEEESVCINQYSFDVRA